ncbi:MAG: ornithine carbamoyltransferase [Deltaproteobacteria bacterium]|nr:ornithine carbamoyltransferase [Deltaproteobacteria bacterium]
MWGKDLVSLGGLGRNDIDGLFALTRQVKSQPGDFRTSLAGRTLGMIFHKPSTRTRVSFEVGIWQLGGVGMYFSSNELQLGRGETIADTARVLSRYLDGVMIRTFRHADVEELAANATIPVINGLTDAAHPCQGLTDYFTMLEHCGGLQGLSVSYVGDGASNVSHSLIEGAAILGVDLTIVCPQGYDPGAGVLAEAEARCASTGGRIRVERDPVKGVTGRRVIYTDVWTSMGQEEEASRRRRDLAGYQVTLELCRHAARDWIFMHCLPAHRGEEVVNEVADHPQSVIFDQAENRLHVQKAAMLTLMKR